MVSLDGPMPHFSNATHQQRAAKAFTILHFSSTFHQQRIRKPSILNLGIALGPIRLIRSQTDPRRLTFVLEVLSSQPLGLALARRFSIFLDILSSHPFELRSILDEGYTTEKTPFSSGSDSNSRSTTPIHGVAVSVLTSCLSFELNTPEGALTFTLFSALNQLSQPRLPPILLPSGKLGDPHLTFALLPSGKIGELTVIPPNNAYALLRSGEFARSTGLVSPSKEQSPLATPPKLLLAEPITLRSRKHWMPYLPGKPISPPKYNKPKHRT